MNRPNILLFGDSITQHGYEDNGWVAQLASYYARHADLLLRGFSGYTSRFGAAMYEDMMDALDGRNIMMATVFFGANDAVDPEFDGDTKRHVPVAEFADNLRSICGRLLSRVNKDDGSVPVVFVISPPPVDSAAWEARCRENFKDRPEVVVPPGSNRSNARVEPYVAACKDVCHQLQQHLQQTGGNPNNVVFVDCFHAFLGRDDWKQCFYDGLHPSQKGHQVIFELLQKTIENQASNCAPFNLGLDFPLHLHIKSVDDLKKTKPLSWL